MKNVFVYLASLFAAVACGAFLNPERNDGNGEIVVRFDDASVKASVASDRIPDPDDFILEISGEDGTQYYCGLFGDSPESVPVPAGNYTVSAVSREFFVPEYDAPQYGDTQVVAVRGGDVVSALLTCRQLNCGVRLNVSSGFSESFSGASIHFKSEEGILPFDRAEKRTAFFRPGMISVCMDNTGIEQVLFSRILEDRQMLALTLVANRSGDGIAIQVDTGRTWISEEYVYGREGVDEENALSVSEAIECGAVEDVWVYGYIAGCMASSSKLESAAPFSKNTNIVLSSRRSAADKEKCLSVELKSGEMRNALNLAEHPENLGRMVYLCGDIVPSYYGLTGIKNLSEYKF